MAIGKNFYKSPDGDIVEASSHEFVTRLKNLGYVRAEADAETEEVLQEVDDTGLDQGTPEVEHVAVEADDPNLVPDEKPSKRDFRREDSRG